MAESQHQKRFLPSWDSANLLNSLRLRKNGPPHKREKKGEKNQLKTQNQRVRSPLSYWTGFCGLMINSRGKLTVSQLSDFPAGAQHTWEAGDSAYL